MAVRPSLQKLASLILASASPRRVDLLGQIGLQAGRIIPADIDETPWTKENPRKYVERMALNKAQAIAALHPKKYVLAADTSVVCGRRILGKPATVQEARAQLLCLSGRRHRVYSAVALYDPKSARYIQRLVCTAVKFKRFSIQELDQYLAMGEWEGKCGGYSIQGFGARYIEWMAGSFSNVVGLPIHETYQMLVGVGLCS